jgi:PAS domain S-box-containing protein
MSTSILTYTEQAEVAAACTEFLLEQTTDLISLHDPCDIGTYRYASASFQTVLGYDPAWLIGQDGSALVHPDDLKLVHEQWASLNTDSTTQATIRYHHADASLRWVEMRWSRFRQRNRSSIIAVGRDVTTHKQLETRFNQIQKLNSIGRLAAGVAHDFHNVMTGINGYAALALLSLPPHSDVRSDLEEIQRSTARATSLTDQLLAFARREIGTPAIININDVICNIDRLLRRIVGEDIELVIIPAAAHGLVNVDTAQIEQVLMNLVVNARDAMPFGGQLAIETRNVQWDQVRERAHSAIKPGSYLSLNISDTGIGMDAGTLQRIFEPFFTAKQAGYGTGLGLAICDEIIKQHGGHICVDSEPGEGTSFTIYLPQVDTNPIETAYTHKIGAGYLPRGDETVLVVEDEPTVLLPIARLLRRQGYTVLTASNGEEAIATAQMHQCAMHVLLTDLVLPKLNGTIVAERLIALYPDLKVIFTSGYAATTADHDDRSTRRCAFLPKPFSHAELAQTVRAVLDANAIDEPISVCACASNISS